MGMCNEEIVDILENINIEPEDNNNNIFIICINMIIQQ